MLASESLADAPGGGGGGGGGTVRNYRGAILARIAHALGVEIDGRFDTITRTARSRPVTAQPNSKKAAPLGPDIDFRWQAACPGGALLVSRGPD